MTRSWPPSRWRTMPARPGNASGSSSVKAWVEPESNHTSRMSVTCSQSAGLSTRPARKRSRAPASNQASAPFSRHGGADARHQLVRLGELGRRDHLARLLVLEHGDGHAPGALARDHPVGLGLHHAAQPVLPGRRHELGLLDGLQRDLAQRLVAAAHGLRRSCSQRLVHGDEPLRRVAEDHRLLGAPGVRILVLEPAARDEHAGFDQRLDDGVVGVALVALVVDDALALEARRVLGEAPVGVDGEGDVGVDAALLQLARRSPSRCRSPRGRGRARCARSPCRPRP